MSTPMTLPQEMLALLETWVARGWLRELDLALVRFFAQEAPDLSPVLMLATALVSHQLGRGHVCLDLTQTLNDPFMALSLPPEQEAAAEEEAVLLPQDLLAGMSVADWVAGLQHPDLVGEDEGRTPLVRVGHRLYLRRYWQYERQVEAALVRRMTSRQDLMRDLPGAEFRQILDALFTPAATRQTDWQKIACALAAVSGFSLITGGPGTGKTTTVVRLLALLQSMALGRPAGHPLHICLAAPTGKAAARLKESIAGAIDTLPAFVQNHAALKASIPHEVVTLHRLLGTRPDSRHFRHHALNPLPLDVLVIDEGSMVDLEMMAAVLLALPAQARLVVLGDKDQLASVEAGSVLGELCQRAQHGHFLAETARWVEAHTGERIEASLHDEQGQPLDQHIVMLRESHRFDATSGIGQLASAVNAGNLQRIREVEAQGYGDLLRHHLPRIDDPKLESILLGAAAGDAAPRGLSGYLTMVKAERPALESDPATFDDWAGKVLDAHGRFQLLCALRNGPYGVSGLNQRIEALLARRNLIQPGSSWYEGRPVLVTRNDYRLGLMNGDIGIALGHPVRDLATGQLVWGIRVAFPKGDGTKGIHWVLPSRLLATETVYALTVHKSQGSEFEHCALLLPPTRNPVLTRELVYTGITRGKRWFSLICVGNPGILDAAVARTVQRSGGLIGDAPSSLARLTVE